MLLTLLYFLIDMEDLILHGYFVTARMLPSHQNCTQEGKLSGCLVMDDDLNQQCSEGRTGMYPS